MFARTLNALLLSGVLLLAAATAAHAADAFERHTTTAVTLPDAGGQWTPVLQVTVPAGVWMVHAKATPVNFAFVADYVRCRIRIGTKQLDASATSVGGAPAAATVVNQGAITTTVTRVFNFECEHDYGVSGEYLDPGASLLVVRAPGPLG